MPSLHEGTARGGNAPGRRAWRARRPPSKDPSPSQGHAGPSTTTGPRREGILPSLRAPARRSRAGPRKAPDGAGKAGCLPSTEGTARGETRLATRMEGETPSLRGPVAVAGPRWVDNDGPSEGRQDAFPPKKVRQEGETRLAARMEGETPSLRGPVAVTGPRWALDNDGPSEGRHPAFPARASAPVSCRPRQSAPDGAGKAECLPSKGCQEFAPREPEWSDLRGKASRPSDAPDWRKRLDQRFPKGTLVAQRATHFLALLCCQEACDVGCHGRNRNAQLVA